MLKETSYLTIAFILFLLNFNSTFAQYSGPNELAYEYSSVNDLPEVQESARDSLLAMQEKVYLHLADDFITNRSMLFFKGYVLNGPQRDLSNRSKVLKVELVDNSGEVLKRQFHSISDGMVSGNLEIPKKTIPGKYYLKAYTRWMQNFGEASYAKKPVFIGKTNSFEPNEQTEVEVQVFPEGGKLISGYQNRLVLTAESLDGNPSKATAVIVDQNDKIIGEVTQYADGLYTTAFIPEPGGNYTLKMSDGSAYPLPMAVDQGYLLQVNNLDANKSRLRVIASPEYYQSTVKLVGEVDGIRYLERNIEMNGKGIVDLEVAKIGIPRGIMSLKLFDSSGYEVANRPIWIDGEEVNIEVKEIIDEQTEDKEIALQISVTDEENNPVQTEVALAINYSAEDRISLSENNTYPLDVEFFTKSKISNQNSYAEQERRSRFLRDIMLLAKIDDLKNSQLEELDDFENLRYPVQNGLELIGHAYDLQNRLLKNTSVKVMAFSEDDLWVRDLQTDSNGLLVLENLQLEGETELVFRTEGDDMWTRLVKVIPVSNHTEELSKPLKKEIKVQERKRVYEPSFVEPQDTTGIINLEEVVVSEKKVKKNPAPSILFDIDYIAPSQIRYQDPERPLTIPQLLLGIPSVVVSGLGSMNPTATIPRAARLGPILWVVDGLPIGQNNYGIFNPLVEIMNLIPAVDVQSIVVLIGPEAAAYGTRGSGGVFVITTRSGAELDTNISRKDGKLTFQGYEPVIDFKDYLQDKPKRLREDSTTIYWNPSIQTDEAGKAVIRVPITEKWSELNIEASTVTNEGRIGGYSAKLTN